MFFISAYVCGDGGITILAYSTQICSTIKQMDEWFIKIYRSILKWEWYDDIPAKVLFLHLLLTANYVDWRWHWVEVKKWCRITSLSKLAKECGLSVQQVRTAINKLKSTQEVTQFQHSDYTFIQVNNWDKYQWQSTQLPTNKQHRGNTEVTTIEEGKKVIRKEIDTNTSECFDIFWKEYPNKIGKPNALKKYIVKEHWNIMNWLSEWKEHWDTSGTEQRYIPHPATWLNQERWKDKPPEDDAPKTLRFTSLTK